MPFSSGLTCVGVVEAKRQRKNVSAAIDQAERYSRGFSFKAGEASRRSMGCDFRCRFSFPPTAAPTSSKSKPRAASGSATRAKPPINAGRLIDWLTPDGLKGQLDIDREAAHAALKTTPFDFGFPLRPYQKRAIQEVEKALEADRRQMLLAMATGTGKTKLAIAMLYRLLAAKRFRRICFVVDRNALDAAAERNSDRPRW